MKELVGVAAGKIWLLLGEKGETSIPQLIQLLKEGSAIVDQALGWLTREGKIEYVSLTEAEREIYLKIQKEEQCRKKGF
jgi:Mn-dependent DtxR family transcriptional regulator